MKIAIGLGLLMSVVFLYFELQKTREDIKKDLKINTLSNDKTFEKLNEVMAPQSVVAKTESKKIEDKKVFRSKLILNLETSSSLNSGNDERLIEMIEENPELALEEIGQLLSSNPHSLVWTNTLNLIKNSKIDPDQKINFLKSQLQNSGKLGEDEDQNIKVVNNYKRILGTLKDIYRSESRNPSELAEEMGNSIPQGELQRAVKSILYEKEPDQRNNP